MKSFLALFFALMSVPLLAATSVTQTAHFTDKAKDVFFVTSVGATFSAVKVLVISNAGVTPAQLKFVVQYSGTQAQTGKYLTGLKATGQKLP